MESNNTVNEGGGHTKRNLEDSGESGVLLAMIATSRK